jgi:bleomycin hydrolase
MDINMSEIISGGQLAKFSDNYNNNSRNKLITNAVTRSGIQAVAFNNSTLAKIQHKFSIDLDAMKVTNQKSSGRCWMFAALNILREKVAKSHNMEYFELSQNYQSFWDKFEKTNYFLECILETLEEPVEGRIVTWLLQNSFNDGGQWDMFVSLIEKYGVVPKDAMPETYHSSNTAVMNQLIMAKLREYAADLRKRHVQGETADCLRGIKENMINEMYTIFCTFFGEPPSSFDFEYRDKDKVFHCERGITPAEFYTNYVGINLQEYVSIINAPTKDKPYSRTFTVKFLGNVKGGRDLIYINTDIDTMKNLALTQLKDNEPVWFGCDVGKMMDRDLGILDAGLYRYDLALDMPFNLTKAERLDYRESCMSHAMVFTGVNLADGKANRWKVENSWGDDKGEKGYFVMSDTWFDEYMYQVVVNRKYLTEELENALKQEPVELAPWDPMGTLAFVK